MQHSIQLNYLQGCSVINQIQLHYLTSILIHLISIYNYRKALVNFKIKSYGCRNYQQRDSQEL